MKVEYVRRKFLDYLERQQGKEYVNDEEHYTKCFEDLIIFESDHYRDFCTEFYLTEYARLKNLQTKMRNR